MNKIRERAENRADCNGPTSLSIAVRRCLFAPRRNARANTRMAAAGMAICLSQLAAAAAFPPEINVSSLLAANGGDGSVGFVLRGCCDLALAGYSVSKAGDVNGDGLGDLIIGAPNSAFVSQPDMA